MLALIAPQYAEADDQLAQGLVRQGAGGALLPSLYGLHSWQGDTRTTMKTVRQVLGPVALPLHVSWTAGTRADVFAPTVEVEGIGRLDRATFDEWASQAFLASLRGKVWTGPPAPLNVFWRAQYTVGRRGQGLLAGRQGLRVSVDKLYFADISHVVSPATSLPPAITHRPCMPPMLVRRAAGGGRAAPAGEQRVPVRAGRAHRHHGATRAGDAGREHGRGRPGGRKGGPRAAGSGAPAGAGRRAPRLARGPRRPAPAAVVGAVALELSEAALVAGVAVDVAVAIDHPTQDNWVTVGGDALALATGYVVGKGSQCREE